MQLSAPLATFFPIPPSPFPSHQLGGLFETDLAVEGEASLGEGCALSHVKRHSPCWSTVISIQSHHAVVFIVRYLVLLLPCLSLHLSFYEIDFSLCKFFSSTGIAGGFLFRAFRPQLDKAMIRRAGYAPPLHKVGIQPILWMISNPLPDPPTRYKNKAGWLAV